ncbi:MAG: hypothetical protein K8T20_14515 [Planctomycetes bacterium]|nr:hypothetical protein [Planctomycetota bacterium]
MLITARYGEMRFVADFISDVPNIKRGTKCVLATDRGTELGEVLVLNKEKPAEHRHRGEGERRSEYDKPGITGTMLRVATPDDISTAQKLHLNEEVAEYDFCAAKIKEMKLDMSLVCSEHILGGEKVIFYFLSEARIDFRDLVKDLSAQFKSRIELRQIGARDSARLVGDYNSCGRQLCCQTFIKDFEPITMKMAKNQRTTLDPEKISGRCGKLKCCLKFENDVYIELKKLLPNIGAKVKTKKGEGEVADQNVIAQEFQLQLATGEWVKCWGSDVIEIVSPGTEDAPPRRRPRLPPPGMMDDKGKPRAPRPGGPPIGAPAAGAPAAGAPVASAPPAGSAPAAPAPFVRPPPRTYSNPPPVTATTGAAPGVPAAPRADRWPRKDKPISQPPRPAPVESVNVPSVPSGEGAPAVPADASAPGDMSSELEKSPSTQRQRAGYSPSVMALGSVDVDDIAALLAKSPTAPPPSNAPPVPLMSRSSQPPPSQQPPAQGAPGGRQGGRPPDRRDGRDRGGRGPRDQQGRPSGGPQQGRPNSGPRQGPPPSQGSPAPAGGAPAAPQGGRPERGDRPGWRERREQKFRDRGPGGGPPPAGSRSPAVAPPANTGEPASPGSPVPPAVPGSAPPQGGGQPRGVRDQRRRHRGGRGRGGGGPRPGGPPPQGGSAPPPPPAPPSPT